MAKRVFIGVVNLWLVFHLAVLILLPNGQSYLNQTVGQFMIPYANAFGIHNPWDFFAPNPLQPLYFKIEPSDKPSWQYPTINRSRWYLDGAERRIAIARMAAGHPELMFKVFLPWLCRLHGQGSVTVTPVVISLHSLSEVQAGVPINDISQQTSQPTASTTCLTDAENAAQ